MTELSVPCWLTAPHPCGYLAKHTARLLFVDGEKMSLSTNGLYPRLIDQGFRRSGQQIYRPQCEHCQACIPIRVPVNHFQPSRRQRRVFKNHTNWLVFDQAASFSAEHFGLYQRYVNTRHRASDSTPIEQSAADQQAYESFLCSSDSSTQMHEFWWQDTLISVAVTDYLPQGLSAVYTFFDPNFAKLSPGCFAILWQIQRAQQLGLPYVYLGYWVADSPKMAYKNEYQPAEIWYQQQWQSLKP